MKYVLSLFAIFVLVLSGPTKAQQLVSSHGAWRVFTLERDGKSLCYIASMPAKKEGNYSKRGEPYLMVTHISGNTDEISASAGYPFKEGDDAKLGFGQTNFDLFTKGELAWAYDRDGDKKVVKEMIRGSEAVLRGTSWKGTWSKDTYSLKGFTDAHRAMKQACQ
jgi:hypothetical protein